MKKILRNVAHNYLRGLLGEADVRLDGKRPWDIQIRDTRFYEHVLCGGSLALGESYVDGWWECPALNQLFFKLLRHRVDRTICKQIPEFFRKSKAFLINCQSKLRAFEVGERHYDAGNDLFEIMLDSRMTYSCGYWLQAGNLEEAQEAKLDLICRKLNLQPGMRLLDIGCGWGSLAGYAAHHYGVEVVGITVSEAQAELARARCAGLPVAIEVKDYRDLTGIYDAVVSVGMFEHVGYKNYKTFMEVVDRSLKEEGLFLLHTIGSNQSVYSCDPWFDKYIFPNGMLPSIRQIGKAVEYQFIMEDWQNLGIDYEKTVLSWHRNFEGNWNRLRTKYDERFRRMWRYYLLSIAGGFRARYIQVWQIVFSKSGRVDGYRSIRCPDCLPAG